MVVCVCPLIPEVRRPIQSPGIQGQPGLQRIPGLQDNQIYVARPCPNNNINIIKRITTTSSSSINVIKKENQKSRKMFFKNIIYRSKKIRMIADFSEVKLSRRHV